MVKNLSHTEDLRFWFFSHRGTEDTETLYAFISISLTCLESIGSSIDA